MVATACLPLCGWSANIATKDRRKHWETEKRDTNIPERIDCYGDEEGIERQNLTDGSSHSGPARLKALIKALNRLDELGYKRSKGQRQFHKAFIGACLKKIYGDEIYRDLGHLLAEYDLEELKSDVILCTPRRFGKTMSVALFAAAYLLTQPNAELSIFSTGRRTSRKILALIWQMVVKLAGTPSVVVIYNQECLEVRGAGEFTSKCYSYPSKVQIDKGDKGTTTSYHILHFLSFLAFFALLYTHPPPSTLAQTTGFRLLLFLEFYF